MSKKDIFYRIATWNEKRGLLNDFNQVNESKMLIEEGLEVITNDKPHIKTVIKYIFSKVVVDNKCLKSIVDGFLDAIIICGGAIIKAIKFANKLQGKSITTEDAVVILKAGLNRVMDANDKKGLERNEHGKIIKSKDFVEPIIPLTLDDLTIEERVGCCCECKEEYDDAGQLK